MHSKCKSVENMEILRAKSKANKRELIKAHRALRNTFNNE